MREEARPRLVTSFYDCNYVPSAVARLGCRRGTGRPVPPQGANEDGREGLVKRRSAEQSEYTHVQVSAMSSRIVELVRSKFNPTDEARHARRKSSSPAPTAAARPALLLPDAPL